MPRFAHTANPRKHAVLVHIKPRATRIHHVHRLVLRISCDAGRNSRCRNLLTVLRDQFHPWQQFRVLVEFRVQLSFGLERTKPLAPTSFPTPFRCYRRRNGHALPASSFRNWRARWKTILQNTGNQAETSPVMRSPIADQPWGIGRFLRQTRPRDCCVSTRSLHSGDNVPVRRGSHTSESKT